jgi:hypothetical protein
MTTRLTWAGSRTSPPLGDAGRLRVPDPDALAVLLLDGHMAFWRRCQTEGDTPQGIDRERIITAWVDLVVSMAT